jgi:hypothetical protein
MAQCGSASNCGRLGAPGAVIRDPLNPGEQCLPHRDAIYCAAGDRRVLRVDPADRTIPWVNKFPARVDSPRIRDQISVELLGATRVGQLFVAVRGSEYEELRILDAHSGKTSWAKGFNFERPLEIRFSRRTIFLVFSHRIEDLDLTTKTIKWKKDFPVRRR